MDDYPLLNLFWTMLLIFLWVLWFFLLFKILTDIFRSQDMGGWGKAGWTIFVVILPFLGILVYLIARGKGMAERDMKSAADADAAFKAYVRDAATTSGTGGSASELAALADLKERGAITEAEFQQAKQKLLAA
ncbi:SHOCT domain-containing protein [Streptomyces sp. NPDC090445]|uniref:SHOCT domain-containing protein n=1 Tax=Streptomyces sp. NPDC090445 TaxID=3365963 RepID=UPI0037F4185E